MVIVTSALSLLPLTPFVQIVVPTLGGIGPGT